MTEPSASTDIRRDIVTLLPRLRRFALTLTGAAPDAEDLVREAASRAIQKSHHWRGEGRIENWLFCLMRSAWTEELRKRRQNGESVEHDPASGESGKHHNPALSLPEGLGSALLLADVEGFTYAEAAAILGVSSDVFASRLCAARIALAQSDRHVHERRA